MSAADPLRHGRTGSLVSGGVAPVVYLLTWDECTMFAAVYGGKPALSWRLLVTQATGSHLVLCRRRLRRHCRHDHLAGVLELVLQPCASDRHRLRQHVMQMYPLISDGVISIQTTGMPWCRASARCLSAASLAEPLSCSALQSTTCPSWSAVRLPWASVRAGPAAALLAQHRAAARSTLSTGIFVPPIITWLTPKSKRAKFDWRCAHHCLRSRAGMSRLTRPLCTAALTTSPSLTRQPRS